MLGALSSRSVVCLLAGRSAGIRGSAVLIPQSVASRRWQCTKPEANKSKDEGSGFKIPKYRPTNFERKILIWGGSYKKQSDIPELISPQQMDASKNKVRIKMSMLMIFMTIVGCIVMIISGKKAARQHETLTKMNLERRALLQKTESEK